MEAAKISKIESMIRHSYMGVVWTHKIQEKQADIYIRQKNIFEIIRIISSSLTAAGLVSIIFASDELWIKLLTALLSFTTLTMEALTKSFDYDKLVLSHKNTAIELLELRDKYQWLIYHAQESDNIMNIEAEYQKAEKKKHEIYKEAPRTTDKAVKLAGKALHVNKDNDFSEDDINSSLSQCLKR